MNLSDTPFPLPAHERALLTSEPPHDGKLPTDTAAWLVVPRT